MSRLEGEAHSWTLSPLEICLEPITVKNNLRIDRCLFGFSALELWGRSPNEAAVKVSR